MNRRAAMERDFDDELRQRLQVVLAESGNLEELADPKKSKEAAQSAASIETAVNAVVEVLVQLRRGLVPLLKNVKTLADGGCDGPIIDAYKALPPCLKLLVNPR